jgi:hypothetical protein
MVLLAAAIVAGVIARQTSVGGVPGPILAMGVLTGAFLVAWRAGIFARAHAMLRLPTIRVQGLEATKKLNEGDFTTARSHFEQLIDSARPLGAFHAVHVLMLGVVEYFEGDTKKGLALATRAIESGWFSIRQTRDVLSAAETWRLFMLLDAGEIAKARALVDAAPKGSLPSGEVAVLVYEREWAQAIERAQALLADPQFPTQGHATVALLGGYAAKQAKADGTKFESVLREKLPVLTQRNPALKRFLSP